MTQPFGVDGKGRAVINEAEILGSQLICSGVGLALPEDFVRQAQEKADLLERRLQRIEAALGFSENPEHNAAIRAAMESL